MPRPFFCDRLRHEQPIHKGLESFHHCCNLSLFLARIIGYGPARITEWGTETGRPAWGYRLLIWHTEKFRFSLRERPFSAAGDALRTQVSWALRRALRAPQPSQSKIPA